jgi:hypothetical protein
MKRCKCKTTERKSFCVGGGVDGRGKGYVKSKGMEFFCLFFRCEWKPGAGEEAVEMSGRRIHIPYTGTRVQGGAKLSVSSNIKNYRCIFSL